MFLVVFCFNNNFIINKLNTYLYLRSVRILGPVDKTNLLKLNKFSSPKIEYLPVNSIIAV